MLTTSRSKYRKKLPLTLISPHQKSFKLQMRPIPQNVQRQYLVSRYFNHD